MGEEPHVETGLPRRHEMKYVRPGLEMSWPRQNPDDLEARGLADAHDRKLLIRGANKALRDLRHADSPQNARLTTHENRKQKRKAKIDIREKHKIGYKGEKIELISEAEDVLRKADERAKTPISKTNGNGRHRIQTPDSDLPLSIEELALKIRENPVMIDLDYPGRNLAIVNVVDRLKDDPKSAGFEDLAEILHAEVKDVTRKKEDLENKGIEPYQAQWIKWELISLKSAQSAIKKIIRGDNLYHDDEGAMELNRYARSMWTELETGQLNALNKSVALDKKRDILLKNRTTADTEKALSDIKRRKEYLLKLMKIAGKTLPVFEAFDKKTLEYGKSPR